MTLEELQNLCGKATEVTEDGRVFSNTNWRGYGRRELVQELNSNGYPSVRLTVAGKRKRICIHRLVALKFLPKRPTKEHEICHIDGNKLNNKVENLRWGTRKDNAADRTRHGNCKSAENGKKSAWKLKKGNDDRIRKLRSKGFSMRQIAELEGISTTAVQRALKEAK